MSLFDHDDLKEMMDLEEGAIEVYYKAAGKNGKKIVARYPYSEDFSQASIDPYMIEDEDPQQKALVITEDVPAPTHKDIFTIIGGVTFEIKREKKLRVGFSVLYLAE